MIPAPGSAPVALPCAAGREHQGFENYEYSSDVRQFPLDSQVSEHTLSALAVTGSGLSALNRIQAARGGVQ